VHRVLVCAPSNHAADHLLQRLVRDTRIPPQYITRVYSRFIEASHGSTYKSGPVRNERGFDIQPHLEEHSLHFKVSQSPQVARQSDDQKAFDKAYEAEEVAVLNRSRVVISTCTNAYLHPALIQGEPRNAVRPVQFHTEVVDEAAQASEPDVVLAATHAALRLVVVGDHQQLGPVITQKNLCAAYLGSLEVSFLERMLKDPVRQCASVMLNVQHRMHASIRRFPSMQYYESKLTDHVTIPHRPELQSLWPQEKEHCRFIHSCTPHSIELACETSFEAKGSLKNAGEAEVAVQACVTLLEKGCQAEDIAIITPYT
ncbi:NAM7, partial [Symbiodinium necroappetens]